MTTYRDLQNAVLANLHSGSADLEQRCALASGITAGALSFDVDDGSQISRGLIEIDSELLWVKAVNANTVTISPFGRGFAGTTAASHSANTMVVTAPRYTRKMVADAVADTVAGCPLYTVKISELNTAVTAQLNYGAPADCDFIIRIEWRTSGPSNSWMPVRRWKLDPTAALSGTTTVTTDVYGDAYSDTYGVAGISGTATKAVDIFDPMRPGQTIKFTYAARPTGFVSDDTTLGSAGCAEEWRDLIVFGATARALQAMEPQRLQVAAIEQQQRAQVQGAPSGTQASRAYWQLYELRVAEELQQLQTTYPTHTHLTR